MENAAIDEETLRKAVALYYDGSNSPTVTAKGIGEDAQNIIDIANQHNVPLCDNPALIELLIQLELGDAIPEELYIAVAHIIAFAYQLQGKTPDDFND